MGFERDETTWDATMTIGTERGWPRISRMGADRSTRVCGSVHNEPGRTVLMNDLGMPHVACRAAGKKETGSLREELSVFVEPIREIHVIRALRDSVPFGIVAGRGGMTP